MTRRFGFLLIVIVAVGMSGEGGLRWLTAARAIAQETDEAPRADGPSPELPPAESSREWSLPPDSPGQGGQGTTQDWLHTPADPPPVQPLFGGDPDAPERPDDAPDKRPAPWPDISQPGPDMGDFPNSAYTLPKGRAYLEMAPLTLAGPDEQNPSSYTWPYLLRYGVTDDLEFRIFGSGLTSVFGDDPRIGFSPVSLDVKIHLWEQNNKWLIPAVSLEAYIQTTWGTKAFTDGWQESLALNFDMLLTKKTNLEWTLSYSGVQDAVNVVTAERFIPRHRFIHRTIHRENVNVYQFSAQWALEHEVTEKLQVFHHGFYNGGILIQQGAGVTVGVGAFWKFSSSLIGFGSLNAGLTEGDPPLLGQVGFAYAL